MAIKFCFYRSKLSDLSDVPSDVPSGVPSDVPSDVPSGLKWTPLTHACAEGHEDVVQLLLDLGVKITPIDLDIAFLSRHT